jgi:hypothetical protein
MTSNTEYFSNQINPGKQIMKRLLIPAVLCCSTFFTSTTLASQCTEPEDVSIPDGSTASTEEMLAGQAAVKEYVRLGEAFLSCMDTQTSESSEELSDEQKQADRARYNALVDKMQAAGQAFNDQIKAYKAANP